MSFPLTSEGHPIPELHLDWEGESNLRLRVSGLVGYAKSRAHSLAGTVLPASGSASLTWRTMRQVEREGLRGRGEACVPRIGIVFRDSRGPFGEVSDDSLPDPKVEPIQHYHERRIDASDTSTFIWELVYPLNLDGVLVHLEMKEGPRPHTLIANAQWSRSFKYRGLQNPLLGYPPAWRTLVDKSSLRYLWDDLDYPVGSEDEKRRLQHLAEWPCEIWRQNNLMGRSGLVAEPLLFEVRAWFRVDGGGEWVEAGQTSRLVIEALAKRPGTDFRYWLTANKKGFPAWVPGEGDLAGEGPFRLTMDLGEEEVCQIGFRLLSRSIKELGFYISASVRDSLTGAGNLVRLQVRSDYERRLTQRRRGGP